MTHSGADAGLVVWGQTQTEVAQIHLVPLCLMWVAAALSSQPLVDSSYGPYILALYVEQWVAPPAIGAFAVVVGVRVPWLGPITKAVLRLLGSTVMGVWIFAFGFAGFMGGAMIHPIIIYSLTTPLLWSFRMVWVGWRDVQGALR